MSPLFDFSCDNEQCKEVFKDELISWEDAGNKEFIFKCPKCGSNCRKLVPLVGKDLSWSQWRALD
jgi:NAD-dependent SIR2 family protein deacetylase